ncbi:ABC transporter substrate-binding protein [candidate division KSB3 bacterium]|uniref:ABC transporter substrate-binding protein n=1 Tax=candidate division KSB3 bacterium TaxID=2044937 RepID=A0A2G6E840_9BACT|nr:MAG: ABC transporter substrate-binding protein [candidate division KSB3 bacterium]PIE30448.1 MAG: ABC transporter substrate-binding protein [candidate division KSB3 bacterium]
MMSRGKIVASLLMLSLMIAAPVMAQEFDWRQFEGTTIVANFPSHFHYNAAMKVIPEFEKLTGITVEVDMLQYVKMHEKQILEMSKPEGDYDVIALVCMWKSEYATGDMLLPLEPFFEDPELAVPGYDFEDLVPAYVDNTGRVGGEKIYMGGPGSTLYALPFGAETSILAYRADLFKEHNLNVPDTYDDIRAAAKYFAENVEGVYGLTMRGASGHQATHAFLLHADPFGAKVFNADWEPTLTSPEAIETLEFMKEMVEYGPPGITGFGYDGQCNAFLEGLAAMYIDNNAIAAATRDPERSKVVGKVEFALHPKHKNRLSETGGFGIGIPANAKNPEAAFIFIQWLTMKEQDKKVVEAGGAPFRMSTLNDPDLQASHPEFAVMLKQLPHADPDWRPIIPEWGEINQTIGVAVNQVLTGEKEPMDAMESITEPLRAIVKKGGYLK